MTAEERDVIIKIIDMYPIAEGEIKTSIEKFIQNYCLILIYNGQGPTPFILDDK